MRCLVVEDDFIQRRVMANFLAPFGSVDIAVNGVEAVRAHTLAIRDEAPYDLILLDIHMPGMDGMDALVKLRQLENDAGTDPGSGARIVMTTSVDAAETIKDSFRKQCDAYLVKPVLRFDLIKQLREFDLIDRSLGIPEQPHFE